MNTINYGANYLNPSELLERLEELRGMDDEGDEFDQDEFNTLNDAEDALKEAIENDGSQLIHEYDFKDHCKELLEYNESSLANLPWFIIIDWEATADNIRVDYSEVEIFSDTYLYR